MSRWSVGMHVQHCCLAMIGVCEALLASSPPPPRRSFSPLTELILLTGRIPRGRAKAPEQAEPREAVSPGELASLIDRSEKLLAAARLAPSGSWFRHFALGVLDRNRSLKFIRIHNAHHLRITRDIRASVRRGSQAESGRSS